MKKPFLVFLIPIILLIMPTCILEPKETKEHENKQLTDSLLWTAWGRADTQSYTTIKAVNYDSVYFYEENDTNKYMLVWGMLCEDTMYNFGRQGIEYGCFVIGEDSLVLYNRLQLLLTYTGADTTKKQNVGLPVSEKSTEVLFLNHIDDATVSFSKNDSLNLQFPKVNAGKDTTVYGGDTITLIGSFSFYVKQIDEIRWDADKIGNSDDSSFTFIAPNYACTLIVALAARYDGSMFARDTVIIFVSDSLLLANDSIAVQTILDVNSLTNKSVSDVTTKTKGRISALRLGGCNIKIIPSQIGQLDFLDALDLSSNLIDSLPSSIGSLTSLKYLNCTNNKLTKIPGQIGNLQNLENLILGTYSLLINTANLLDSLPSEIGNLSNLKYLHVGTNQLKSIPKSVGNLTKLEELYLPENQLSNLPDEIGNLSSLRCLDLGSNQLADIPSTIGNLNELYSLQLDNNILSNLPSSISNLKKLKYLYIYENKIKIFPEVIDSLTNIEYLNMSCNELENIPEKISNLKNLHLLNIAGNRFSQFPLEVTKLNQLEILYLGYNSFDSIPDEIQNLTEINCLQLEYGSITYLSPNIGKLSKLTSLILTHNKLNSIPSEIGNLSQLQSVHLCFNNLSNLPIEILNLKPETFYVQSNRLCDLSDSLIVWLDEYSSAWRTGQDCN